MQEDDFYIGYLPKAPELLTRWLRKIIASLLLLLAVIAFFVAGNQHRFAATNFEYGQITELKGVVSLTPVPRLILKAGKDRQGLALTKSVLLVNLGKSGVGEIFQNLEKQLGRPLTNFELTLAGTLIYGEGKTVFELTNQEASILNHTPLSKAYVPAKIIELGEQSFVGEIIDPKCYFGVMKPGSGKVHRSCAVRCIAGGISPVMLTKNEKGLKQYVLLLAKQGGANNNLISRLAGKPITINGNLRQVDDWLVLDYDEKLLSKAISETLNGSDGFRKNPGFLAGSKPLDAGVAFCN